MGAIKLNCCGHTFAASSPKATLPAQRVHVCRHSVRNSADGDL